MRICVIGPVASFWSRADNKNDAVRTDEPEMIKVEEIVLPPKENTEEDEVKRSKRRFTFFHQSG